MNTNYVVLDLETTVRNREVGKNLGTSHCKDNWVVLECYKHGGGPTIFNKYSDDSFDTGTANGIPSSQVIVGQNIKFDLLYYLRDDGGLTITWIQKGGRIWDTQLAEYLLTFQQSKWASLNQLSAKYGGTQKDDKIKEFWDNGFDTTDIPPTMLIEYCEYDILNTERAYLAQREKAAQLGMLPLIESQMDCLLATVLMEHNGMMFDKERAQQSGALMLLELNKNTSILQSLTGLPNPMSMLQLSSYLFGGGVDVEDTEGVLDADGNPTHYKSGVKKGMLKTRKCKRTLPFLAQVKPIGSPNRNGYPTGDDDLKKVLKANPLHRDVHDVIELVMTNRDLQKQCNTYFLGYSALVWKDGCIHGSINHCQTETGRLSSSKPNLQNVSNKSTEVESDE